MEPWVVFHGCSESCMDGELLVWWEIGAEVCDLIMKGVNAMWRSFRLLWSHWTPHKHVWVKSRHYQIDVVGTSTKPLETGGKGGRLDTAREDGWYSSPSLKERKRVWIKAVVLGPRREPQCWSGWQCSSSLDYPWAAPEVGFTHTALHCI